MKRRLSLAIALLGSGFINLDEPTVGVILRCAFQSWEEYGVKPTKTILMTTCDGRSWKRVDRVVLLFDGRIIADDSLTLKAGMTFQQ